jgi:hypothetical protein
MPAVLPNGGGGERKCRWRKSQRAVWQLGSSAVGLLLLQRDALNKRAMMTGPMMDDNDIDIINGSDALTYTVDAPLIGIDNRVLVSLWLQFGSPTSGSVVARTVTVAFPPTQQ